MILQFNPNRGLIIVPTRLSGPYGEIIAHMALSTGATNTILTPGVLTAVGYDAASAPGATAQMNIVTGSAIGSMPRIHVDRIEAAGITRLAFPVGSYSLPPVVGVDGVLGLDFFRGRKVAIDFDTGRVSVD